MQVTHEQGERRDALMNELEQRRDALTNGYKDFERDAESEFDELRRAAEKYNERIAALYERHVVKPLATFNGTIERAADFVRDTAKELRASVGPKASDRTENFVNEWERTAKALVPVELDEPPAVDVDEVFAEIDPRDKNDLPGDGDYDDALRSLSLSDD